MKTSKSIFISLLGTFALLILAAAIDLRITGRKNGNLSDEFRSTRIAVSSFKVLIVHNSMNISVVKKDSSFAEVIFLKDSVAPKVNFTSRGDTLLVSDFEKSSHRNVSVTIHANDSLRLIRLNNSNVEVDRVGTGSLSFELDQSSLSLNQDTLLKVPSKSIYIVARNHSEINSNDFGVELLDLVLANSEANLQIKAKKMTGSLTDNSRIFARQPEEIALKKDLSSKINVNDY
jgi:hypothetical protein